MTYLIGGVAAIWFGAAILTCIGWWQYRTRHTGILRCACGRVPLADPRSHLDHPSVRHTADVCSPQREVIR